jgi:hypothetical protein
LWPICSNFRQANDVILTGKNIVLSMKGMVAPGSSTFGEIQMSDSFAIFQATALQYFLHLLSTQFARLMNTNTPIKNMNMRVFLEALRDDAGNVVEYRLWINQPEGDVLTALYGEACRSKRKQLAINGMYADLAPAGGSSTQASAPAAAPTQAIVVHNGQSSSAAAVAASATNGSRPITMFELYTRVDNCQQLDAVARAISQFRQEQVRDPFAVYSIETAVRNTSINVCQFQRTATRYRSSYLSPDITLYAAAGIYNVSYFSWDPAQFMCKIFPHLQLDDAQNDFDKHMKIIAQTLDVKTEMRARAARAAHVAAYKGGARSDVSRAGASSMRSSRKDMMNENEFEDDALKALRGIAAKILDPAPVPASTTYEGRTDNNNENEPPYQLGEVVPMSAEQIMETRRSMNLYADMDDNKFEEQANDHVSAMRLEFITNTRVIEANYHFELEEARSLKKPEHALAAATEARRQMHREKNQLAHVLANKYTNFCTSHTSDVSHTATELYKIAISDNLFGKMASGDFDVKISDLTLSPMTNWEIQTDQGFHTYEKITFHQSKCTFLMVMLGNMFVREQGLHANVVLSGDGASGKSYLATAVRHNIGFNTCIQIASESRQAKMNDETIVDGFRFDDDASMTKYATSGDNQDGELRQLLTSGTLRREVTEYVDGIRRKRTIVYNWSGCTLGCTNQNQVEILGDTMPGKKTEMAALFSRYITININTIKDSYLSVQSSNASENCSAEFTKQRDAFRGRNILMHILQMQAHHGMHIGWVPKVDMSCFDIVFPAMLTYLDKSGVKMSGSNREAPKVKLYCLERVIRRAIIELFFIPTGLHYHKKYEPRMLMDLMPVCNEEDVFNAFSNFFPNFYPTEIATVVRILRTMAIESLQSRDNTVKYDNPYVDEDERLARIRFPEVAEAAEADAAASAAANAAAGEHEMRDDDNDSRNESRNERARVANIANNVRGVGFIRTAAATDDASRKRSNPALPTGERDPRQPRIYDNSIAKTHMNISYMRFNNYKDAKRLADVVYQLSANEAERPSHGAVRFCMDMMLNWRVATPSWQVPRSLKKEDFKIGDVWRNALLPLTQNPDTEVMRNVLVAHNGNLYVNYALLIENNSYENLCESAIRSVCYKTTIARRVRLAIRHPKYPWLTRVLKIEPTKLERVITNSHFISPAEQLIVTGSSNRTMLDPGQLNPFTRISEEIDFSCLIKFFERQNLVDMPTLQMIFAHHWASIMTVNRQLIEKKAIENPGVSVAYTYPDTLIDMYEEVRNVQRLLVEGACNKEQVQIMEENIGDHEAMIRIDAIEIDSNVLRELSTVTTHLISYIDAPLPEHMALPLTLTRKQKLLKDVPAPPSAPEVAEVVEPGKPPKNKDAPPPIDPEVTQQLVQGLVENHQRLLSESASAMHKGLSAARIIEDVPMEDVPIFQRDENNIDVLTSEMDHMQTTAATNDNDSAHSAQSNERRRANKRAKTAEKHVDKEEGKKPIKSTFFRIGDEASRLSSGSENDDDDN